MSESPDAATLKRLRLIITAVLVGLFAISVGVALAELWPVPWLDDLGLRWFGRSSWKLRIIGTLCVFGLMLLAALLLALLGKTLLRRK